MKKIYYTTEVEFHDGDYDLGPTGNKTIATYVVENGELVSFFTREVDLECISEEAIQDYLDDNGYGDNSYEFKLL